MGALRGLLAEVGATPQPQFWQCGLCCLEGGGITVLTGSTHLHSPPTAGGCWHSTAPRIYGSRAVISLHPQKPPGEIDGSPGQPLVTAA